MVLGKNAEHAPHRKVYRRTPVYRFNKLELVLLIFTKQFNSHKNDSKNNKYNREDKQEH